MAADDDSIGRAARTILERMAAQRLTVLVENQGRLVFASDRPGIEPLRQLVRQRPELLDGSDVGIPAIGLAVAYLLIGFKVGRVFTRTITHEAHKAFDAEGIEHTAQDKQKRLAADEPLGALDERARSSPTMLAFVEELKQQAT